jgi:hypothetical protein
VAFSRVGEAPEHRFPLAPLRDRSHDTVVDPIRPDCAVVEDAQRNARATPAGVDLLHFKDPPPIVALGFFARVFILVAVRRE